jgi:hypothetical protein
MFLLGFLLLLALEIPLLRGCDTRRSEQVWTVLVVLGGVLLLVWLALANPDPRSLH